MQYFRNTQTGQAFVVQNGQVSPVSSIPPGVSVNQGAFTLEGLQNQFSGNGGGSTNLPTTTVPGTSIPQPGNGTSISYGVVNQPVTSTPTNNGPTNGPTAIPDDPSSHVNGQLSVPAGYALNNGDYVTVNGRLYSYGGGKLSPADPAMFGGSIPSSIRDISTYAPGYTAPTSTPSTNQSPTDSSSTPVGSTSGSSSDVSSGVPSGVSSDVSTIISSAPPEWQALLTTLNNQLQQLQKNGQVLNPNVTLDATHVAQFLDQAKAQVDPYFTTQLAAAKDSLSSSLNYASGNELTDENTAQTNYGNNLRTLQGNEANKGFAQSGERNRAESDLATTTQNSLNAARNTLGYNSTNAAQNFAQTYGGSNVPTAPTIGAAPRVVSGESNFDTTGPIRSLYQLNPSIYQGLIGSQQNTQTQAENSLASQLGTNYTQGLANNQARGLNL